MTANFSRLIRQVPSLFLILLLLAAGLSGQEPNLPWLQYQQAATLYKEKASTSQILDLLREVQRTTKDSVLVGRCILLAASSFERDLQYDKALLELQKFDQPGKNYLETMKSEAWLRSAVIYLKQEKTKSARKQFNMILNGLNNQFLKNEALLGLAWIYADENKWETSDSLLSLIISDSRSTSKDERILILKSRQLIATGQYQEAIGLLENTESQSGMYYLATAHELAGNRIMAVSVYKKLHDRFPGTPEAQLALFQAAEVFMRAEDWLAARSEFKRLLQSGLENADGIHFRLGWIYMNLKELEQALTEFRYPSATENAGYFRYMEAECLRRQGATDSTKLDQAIILFHNIASVDLQSPLAPLAKLKAGMTEMEKGDRSGALVSLRQFLSLYPKDELSPAVYFLLGVNENERNSQKYFDQIIQQNQKSKFFDVSYFAMQNFDFQRENYQQVITRNFSITKKSGSEEKDFWQRANHLLMAESAYFLKHYAQAEAEYDLAIAEKEDDLAEKALIGKAWCTMQTMGAEAALPQFKKIRDELLGDNRILADYGYATTQFMRQEYTDAIKSYPVSINTDLQPEMKPLVIRSLFRSAQCYARLQYYMQAIETWDRLATNYPESDLAVEGLYNIGDIYFRADHFADADSVYQLIISRYPGHALAVESALKLAQSSYNAGDYEGAIERYQAFINTYPDHEKNKEALEGIQLSYYQLGQLDQASATLQKVVEQTANSDLAIDARYRIAVNHYQEKNYQTAIEAFKEILTLYPNSSYAVDAQFALSKCYIAEENYKSASEELLRFVQYFPQSPQLPEAHFLLGVGYYQLESYLSAIDNFNEVIQKYPDSEFHAPALKNSAWCYDRLQESDKALQAFNTYIKLYPETEDLNQIKLQVARLLLDNEQSQQAIEKFRELQKITDIEISMEACYRLGMFYLSKERVKDAESTFQLATRTDGGDNYYRLSSLAQLAALYENSGNSQKAISTYEMLAASTTEERWTAAAQERIELLRLQSNQ
ncbi:MAG: tetratricopeptide repeat protein [bacterium]|nr:MAG: tetratricopeptide repeat protein [bacterium]